MPRKQLNLIPETSFIVSNDNIIKQDSDEFTKYDMKLLCKYLIDYAKKAKSSGKFSRSTVTAISKDVANIELNLALIDDEPVCKQTDEPQSDTKVMTESNDNRVNDSTDDIVQPQLKTLIETTLPDEITQTDNYTDVEIKQGLGPEEMQWITTYMKNQSESEIHMLILDKLRKSYPHDEYEPKDAWAAWELVKEKFKLWEQAHGRSGNLEVSELDLSDERFTEFYQNDSILLTNQF
jgi:hypothetical protein